MAAFVKQCRLVALGEGLRKYEAAAIEAACDQAWRSRGFRHRMKRLLERHSR
ncbi:MAG: hypothetical protein WD403_10160 [Pirellulales bacterium]